MTDNEPEFQGDHKRWTYNEVSKSLKERDYRINSVHYSDVNTTLKNSSISNQKNFLILQNRFTKVRKFIVLFLILFVVLFSNKLINSNLVNPSQTLSSESFHVDSNRFYIELHSIKVDVLSIKEIYVAETFSIKNTHNSSSDSIEIWINQTVSNLKIQDSEGTLVFDKTEFSDSSFLLNIYFRSELQVNNSETIDIWYSLNRYPIAELDNSHLFHYNANGLPI